MRHYQCSNVTLERHPPSSECLFEATPYPSRSTLRGAGTDGDPPGRFVPRLTIRPPRLALAALARLTTSSGGGIGLPAADVGPCGACAPPDINRPVEGNHGRRCCRVPDRQPTGTSCRNLAARTSQQSFPGIEPGNDWTRVQPGARRCGARALCPDVVTIVRSGGIGAGERERRPCGHRARHGRLDDSPDRLRQSGTEIVHTPASLMKRGRVNRG
jgi:hypothetical protein